MLITRSHKIELRPNEATVKQLVCSVGCARFAYNWALAETKRLLDEMAEAKEAKVEYEGPKPSDKYLKAKFNEIKRTEFPWQLEVTKCAAEGALKNFGRAKQNFFQKRSKFPKLHKKGKHDSYYVSNDKFRVEGKYIFLPKIGRVKMHESLKFQGKLMSAVVSRKADRWFVSIAVEFEVPDPKDRENQAVGVDVGIKHFAVLSTGEKIEGPKAFERGLKGLKRKQKRVSRKKKGSNNRRKAAVRLAKAHWRIANRRHDFLHKLSSRLVEEFDTVVIEDLNVSGMVRNHTLARRISDAGWGEFRRQLEYKAPVVGCRILVADRYFPSSKTCSNCGYKLPKLDLSTREWTCPSCGRVHDRDHNAAINLENLAAG